MVLLTNPSDSVLLLGLVSPCSIPLGQSFYLLTTLIIYLYESYNESCHPQVLIPFSFVGCHMKHVILRVLKN